MVHAVLAAAWLTLFILLCWLTGQGQASDIYFTYYPQEEDRCERLAVACFDTNLGCVHWQDLPADAVNFTLQGRSYVDVALPLPKAGICCRDCQQSQHGRCIRAPPCPAPPSAPREPKLGVVPPEPACPTLPEWEPESAEDILNRRDQNIQKLRLPRYDPDVQIFLVLLFVNTLFAGLVLTGLWWLREITAYPPSRSTARRA